MAVTYGYVHHSAAVFKTDFDHFSKKMQQSKSRAERADKTFPSPILTVVVVGKEIASLNRQTIASSYI
jgi:hypothetical protein